MRSQELLRIREEVLEKLKEASRMLNATIYLFDSHARGDYMVDSDVDIVVVSDVFKGMDHPSRVQLVRSILPPHIGFDIIALTIDEFQDKRSKPFFKDISRYWIRIEPE
ncbi:MAG: nucleotidyltransferase domain-containing protein [Desulfurococcales archaeon]|nr:nucleotidyltransferase domain-containing protein [Desulfurococcales archaeon]